MNAPVNVLRHGWIRGAAAGLAVSAAVAVLLAQAPAPTTGPAPAAPAPIPANAPTAGAGYFFAQAADPQFGFMTGNPRDFAHETLNLEYVINSVNRIKPAFLIICGDLVHDTGDAGQMAEYKRIIALLNPAIPLYTVSGNHDLTNTPTAETLAAYRRQYGKDYYSFRHQDLYGIVLNSTIISDASQVPEEEATQLAWLKDELAKAKAAGARSIMVFQHHPFFVTAPDDNNTMAIPREKRKVYLDLFKESGVTHIFAGHLHRNAEAEDPPLKMITTSAIGRQLGTDSSGMRIVYVRPTGVEYPYYNLGAIPTTVNLAARGRGGRGPGGAAGAGAGAGRGPAPSDGRGAAGAPPARGL
jgi:Icc-related predicted phosphoesterase